MASSMMELINRTSVLSDSVTTSVSAVSLSGAVLPRFSASSWDEGRATDAGARVPLPAGPAAATGLAGCTL